MKGTTQEHLFKVLPKYRTYIISLMEDKDDSTKGLNEEVRLNAEFIRFKGSLFITLEKGKIVGSIGFRDSNDTNARFIDLKTDNILPAFQSHKNFDDGIDKLDTSLNAKYMFHQYPIMYLHNNVLNPIYASLQHFIRKQQEILIDFINKDIEDENKRFSYQDIFENQEVINFIRKNELHIFKTEGKS